MSFVYHPPLDRQAQRIHRTLEQTLHSQLSEGGLDRGNGMLYYRRLS